MSSQSAPESVAVHASESVEVLGHRIAYRDDGTGEQTLLLVHGNPVSSHVFARLVDRLPDRYRCVAPDLLGFGQSEKPPDEAAYTLPKHIRIVAELVRELDLRDVVLVGHDWGGPIGVGAALDDEDRYAGLVLLNTLTEAPMRIRPRYKLPFHAFLRLDRLADYVVKERNLFQRVIVGSMDESDKAVYLRANDSPETRAGIAAFPRMIPHDRDHPNYPLLRDIMADLEEWDVPALVLFSDRDSVFSAEQGERLAERMADARFGVVEGAKHYLQYERPDEVAAAIEEFIQEEL